eukprot:scaffold103466_cov54-Phaeocystis_antarctica.AAC.2
MEQMFLVCSSPCPAPNLQSSPPLHAACTAIASRPPASQPAQSVYVQPAAELRHIQPHDHVPYVPRALLPLLHIACTAVVRCLPLADWYTSPRTVCPPLDSPQEAPAFNQPLIIDTSSATDMAGMFAVRSSPCPAPNVHSIPRLHATCPAVAHRLPARTLPPFDSRQYASAFDQPLSFDTSSVTTMYGMFYVRSSPRPAPNPQSSPPCTLRAPRSPAILPPPSLNLAPHRMSSFRLSAGRAGVEPAAELRHLQRHNHIRHVLGALLPVPCSESTVDLSPARCLRRGRSRIGGGSEAD